MSAVSEVYINGHFSEPMSTQHNFQNAYNMTDPVEAMSRYARVMHQHTKVQLEQATMSAHRRSASDSRSSLQSGASSTYESISSTDS